MVSLFQQLFFTSVIGSLRRMKEDGSNNNYTTVQMNRLNAIRNSKNPIEGDMLKIRIQALEWIQCNTKLAIYNK